MQVDRRTFLGVAGATAAAATAFIPSTHAAPVLLDVPDSAWCLWLDHDTGYLSDGIFLPSQVKLDELPITPPAGG